MWDRGRWFFKSSERSCERPPQGRRLPVLQYLIRHHHWSLSHRFDYRKSSGALTKTWLCFVCGARNRYCTRVRVFFFLLLWSRNQDRRQLRCVFSYVRRLYTHLTSLYPEVMYVWKVNSEEGPASVISARVGACFFVINSLHHHYTCCLGSACPPNPTITCGTCTNVQIPTRVVASRCRRNVCRVRT